MHCTGLIVAGSASAVRLAVTPTSGGRRPPSSLADLNEPGIAVERFRASASPQAYQLAVCLSAVPLTLPIMRLVQHFAAPASPTSALAEVILGGLISHTGDGTYEFLQGIREALLRELRRSELIAVFRPYRTTSPKTPAGQPYLCRNRRICRRFCDSRCEAFSWCRTPSQPASACQRPPPSPEDDRGTAAARTRRRLRIVAQGRSGIDLPDQAAELLAGRRPAAPSRARGPRPPGGLRISSSAPGAGKGTQAQFIASRLAIPRISTGDIFRYNVTNNTELGRKAREYMERDELVPDKLTVAVVRDRLGEDDAREGFLLDGFPGTCRRPRRSRRCSRNGTPG